MTQIDIDSATGAPVVKPFVDSTKVDEHKVTVIPDAPPAKVADAKDNQKSTVVTIPPVVSNDKENETPNQGQQTKTVEYPNTIESLEKKVEDKRAKLIELNDAAHAAHQELMEAQRELLKARAS